MKRTLIWIGALVVGAVLGLLGINWLNEVMNVVATIYTRLFQLLAVLTTFAAAIVGAVLYLIIAPSNLPSLPELSSEASASIPNNILRPILEGNVLSLLLLAFVVGIGLSKLPDSENKSVVVKGLLGLQDANEPSRKMSEAAK